VQTDDKGAQRRTSLLFNKSGMGYLEQQLTYHCTLNVLMIPRKPRKQAMSPEVYDFQYV
jgi:hypothetical protein